MSPIEYTTKLKKTVEELSHFESFQSVCHEHKVGEPMPSVQVLEELVYLIRDIIFPGYFVSATINPETVKYHLGVNTEKVFELLCEQILAGICFTCSSEEADRMVEMKAEATELASNFVGMLPEIRSKLVGDVKAAYNGDPASKSYGEVIFCYPAIRAITNYRVANALLHLGVPLIPRIISEMAHSETGIDIHPEATIGSDFTIDHGTGVVIGATAIIGNNVKLFQGVTLGAKSFPLDEAGNPIKGIARHPILEDNVVIYSNATILGRITIGKDSVIGGNVWVTSSVPEGSKIVQVKARDGLFYNGAGI